MKSRKLSISFLNRPFSVCCLRGGFPLCAGTIKKHQRHTETFFYPAGRSVPGLFSGFSVRVEHRQYDFRMAVHKPQGFFVDFPRAHGHRAFHSGFTGLRNQFPCRLGIIRPNPCRPVDGRGSERPGTGPTCCHLKHLPVKTIRLPFLFRDLAFSFVFKHSVVKCNACRKADTSRSPVQGGGDRSFLLTTPEPMDLINSGEFRVPVLRFKLTWVPHCY